MEKIQCIAIPGKEDDLIKLSAKTIDIDGFDVNFHPSKFGFFAEISYLARMQLKVDENIKSTIHFQRPILEEFKKHFESALEKINKRLEE